MGNSKVDRTLTFGLGQARKADLVEIRWPNGQIETLRDIAGDAVIYVKEGHGLVGAHRFR